MNVCIYDLHLCICFFCVYDRMTLILNIFYSERKYVSSASECYSAFDNSMHTNYVISESNSISDKYSHQLEEKTNSLAVFSMHLSLMYNSNTVPIHYVND